MLDGLFSYPKRHFYLSENNRHYFFHIIFELRKYSSFSSHFNPKIVGDNRSSEQIFMSQKRSVVRCMFLCVSTMASGYSKHSVVLPQLYWQKERSTKHSFYKNLLKRTLMLRMAKILRTCYELTQGWDLSKTLSIFFLTWEALAHVQYWTQ